MDRAVPELDTRAHGLHAREAMPSGLRVNGAAGGAHAQLLRAGDSAPGRRQAMIQHAEAVSLYKYRRPRTLGARTTSCLVLVADVFTFFAPAATAPDPVLLTTATC